VAAVVRRGSEVLLIQQQGPGDPAPVWALPGGRVEPGETLTDALRREVREETGLCIGAIGRLIYVAQMENREAPLRSPGEIPSQGETSTAFVFDVTEFSGELQPNDPDDLIFGIGFFPREEAIERLERLPWRIMREPIVSALKGDAPAGSLWVYRREGAGDALVARAPAPGVVEAETPLATPPADPAIERQHNIMVLGCMAIMALFVIIVVMGIIFIAQGH
jgi:8-oxo-dGTP diphosphatase